MGLDVSVGVDVAVGFDVLVAVGFVVAVDVGELVCVAVDVGELVCVGFAVVVGDAVVDSVGSAPSVSVGEGDLNFSRYFSAPT